MCKFDIHGWTSNIRLLPIKCHYIDRYDYRPYLFAAGLSSKVRYRRRGCKVKLQGRKAEKGKWQVGGEITSVERQKRTPTFFFGDRCYS